MRTKIGQVYTYEIHRVGSRKRSPLVVKVLAVGKRDGETGISKKHILVKMVESTEKPFWVREESLK